MNDETCGTVRELIPDLVGSRLSEGDAAAAERHIVGCRACAAEAELARVILEGRPAVPPGLVDRLLSSVTTVTPGRREATRTWWGVSAAAIAALALGIGLASDPAATTPGDVPAYAYEAAEGDVWASDDGLLAGAPLFDDLSDDALMQLLDELSVDAAGGAV